MPAPSQLQAMLITLYLDGKQSLVVMLAEDGSINRLGTGAADSRNGDLFVGATDTAAFKALAARVDPKWFEYSGRQFEMPNRSGLTCKLRLVFKAEAGDHVLEFLYGSDSQGPPADIATFVESAVELTNPWYESQKQLVGKKPWWKFW